MKIATLKGVGSVEDLKVFKPIQKILIKATVAGGSLSESLTDEKIRIRLINSVTGENKEIVSETSLSVLSEISCKKEGFVRNWQPRFNNDSGDVYAGYKNFIFVLNDSAALELSNDKYLQIDLFDLSSVVTYEVFGFEYPITSPFVKSYSKMYVAPKELEKQFSVGNFEYLALPLDTIKEIQFFTKDGSASPVYLPDELKLDQEMSNDITSVSMDANGVSYGRGNFRVEDLLNYVNFNEGAPTMPNAVLKFDVKLPIEWGFVNWALLDLRLYKSFNIKRVDNDETMMFFFIDSIS